MQAEEDPQLEAVFIAATVDEIDFVEKLLDSEDIEYEVTIEPYMKNFLGGTCLNGVLFEVRAGQADYCRRLFQARGLERGIVDLDR